MTAADAAGDEDEEDRDGDESALGAKPADDLQGEGAPRDHDDYKLAPVELTARAHALGRRRGRDRAGAPSRATAAAAAATDNPVARRRRRRGRGEAPDAFVVNPREEDDEDDDDVPASAMCGDNAPKPQKFLLDRVSFACAPGEALAIMGPSGAGKSTMLSAIAGRSERVPPGANRSGEVLFNGAPRAALPRTAVSYVMQDDVFLEALSVQETLEFAAALKLGGDAASVGRRADATMRAGSASARACGSAT